ncbi:MAG: hypothetical protein ACKVWR_12710 [Acidimicrobiales bacterium]
MNWTWSIRSADGGMNGLEFARCLTAGGFERVLVHAAPAHAQVEVTADDGSLVARGRPERTGDYSPITELVLMPDDETPTVRRVERAEIWPDESQIGLPVLLAGGEAGILTAWRHAPDRSWWRWSVEFSNHAERPPDWSPPG